MGIHAENINMAMSPGRLDQILYPYYKRDIEAGRLDIAEAIEIYDEKSYTVKQAAAELGLHHNTIRNRIRADQTLANDGKARLHFPNVYRMGTAATHPYYIPERDIHAYKRRVVTSS